MGSIPGLETSMCQGCSHKKENKSKNSLGWWLRKKYLQQFFFLPLFLSYNLALVYGACITFFLKVLITLHPPALKYFWYLLKCELLLHFICLFSCPKVIWYQTVTVWYTIKACVYIDKACVYIDMIGVLKKCFWWCNWCKVRLEKDNSSLFRKE